MAFFYLTMFKKKKKKALILCTIWALFNEKNWLYLLNRSLTLIHKVPLRKWFSAWAFYIPVDLEL